MAENMTVGEALKMLRSQSNDRLGEGPVILIFDECNTYRGTCSYFIFNGAYEDLRNKKVQFIEDNAIVTEGTRVLF